jgi:hypothetical protein
MAASLLADFGAEVIKLELPGVGDGLRAFLLVARAKMHIYMEIVLNLGDDLRRFGANFIAKGEGQDGRACFYAPNYGFCVGNLRCCPRFWTVSSAFSVAPTVAAFC